MAVTKENIFNWALNALLLQRQVTNADSDNSNEARVLRNVYSVSLEQALADMDLTATAKRITLELIEELDDHHWLFAYNYPSNCAKFRRILSAAVIDTRDTHIPKEVSTYDGDKAIFTNQEEAEAEIIPTDIDLSLLSADAGLAIALKLAYNATPLIVGKGAKALRDSLKEDYKVAKADAQELDHAESFSFHDEATDSEFVRARTE